MAVVHGPFQIAGGIQRETGALWVNSLIKRMERGGREIEGC